uniref:Uncharacterized protein n=1 Tax=Trichobilharzia regenti TaxID=157069 RepID=A0AA85JE53_TRIRE
GIIYRYNSNVTESEVEVCIRPRPDRLLISCQMLAEQGSFLEVKSTLSTVKRMHNILSISDNLEETFLLTISKRP